MHRRLAPLLGLLLFTCTSPFSPTSPARSEPGPRRQPWDAPPLERCVAVRQPATGRTLPFDELLDALSEADVVFLGETHTDETTHRVELAIYRGLLERRAGRVVLALEMFERDVQATLDAYLRGELDEATFLAQSRPWRNYATAYRPLVQHARATGGPVVASNFPRPLLRRVATAGLDALDALPDDERRQAPLEVHPNSASYHRRVDNAIRGHLGMVGGRAPDDPRLTSTQTLWDNAMGESCARALEEHPGHAVLHVNGSFHSAYRDGTVAQLRRRRPRARVLTVAIVPTPHPAVAEPHGRPVADFVVYAETWATDVEDGRHSVYTTRELDYRLHLPESSSDGAPVPLLVWLGEDGLTAEDGLALWRGRLGDEVAIAALEPPYRGLADDLAEGGRWFWSDSFPQDLGALQSAIERVWGYVLRHHAIDPARVCVAGEGSGATAVAAFALWTDRVAHRAVGFAPAGYARLRDIPLPLPELRGDDTAPTRSLRLHLDEASAEWWADELAAWRDVELDAQAVRATDDPWSAADERVDALRTALGLPARPATSTAERRYVVVPDASVRARHWARLAALEALAADGVPVAVVAEELEGASRLPLEVRAADFAAEGALPRCPGPFGGTTVVVLPAGTSPEEADAWLELAREDPLQAASRFHRLRVARAVGQPGLPEVLAELRAAQRTHVLIVPAVFHDEGDGMRELRRAAAPFADTMTLHWRPGLGGLDRRDARN